MSARREGGIAEGGRVGEINAVSRSESESVSAPVRSGRSAREGGVGRGRGCVDEDGRRGRWSVELSH